jgi:hypothetical protein
MELGHPLIDDYCTNPLGGTFDYQQTNERFGIVSLPTSVIGSYNMKPSNGTSTRNMSLVNTAEKLLQLSVLPAAYLPAVGYSNSKFVYKFLSDCQQTDIAVTAIHTQEEMDLFKRLLVEKYEQIYTQITRRKKGGKKGGKKEGDEEEEEEEETHNPAVKPCFEIFAHLWSSYCNKDNNIYYKLPEHLQAYFNIMEDRKKYGESVSLNIEASREV